MRGLLALALVVASSANTLGGIAGPTGASSLRFEAAGVFLAVMSDDDQPQRCQFDLKWSRYPIPVWLSNEELGGSASDTPIYSTLPLPYAEALDPHDKNKQAFCSQEDASTYFREHPGRRSLYSFPAFSQDFNTAIVIDVEDANVGKKSTFFSITALILKKRANGWKLNRYVELAIS